MVSIVAYAPIWHTGGKFKPEDILVNQKTEYRYKVKEVFEENFNTYCHIFCSKINSSIKELESQFWHWPWCKRYCIQIEHGSVNEILWIHDILHPERRKCYLPSDPGIYMFFNRYSSLMYVGRASNLLDRIRSHFTMDSHTSHVKHNFRRISYIVVSKSEHRKALEYYLINHLKPPLNIKNVHTYETQRYDPRYFRFP